jgi:hypothetical protein
LHAVGITGVKLITDNFEQLKNKKIIVFGTGCSPAKKQEEIMLQKDINIFMQHLIIILEYYL